MTPTGRVLSHCGLSHLRKFEAAEVTIKLLCETRKPAARVARGLAQGGGCSEQGGGDAIDSALTCGGPAAVASTVPAAAASPGPAAVAVTASPVNAEAEAVPTVLSLLQRAGYGKYANAIDVKLTQHGVTVAQLCTTHQAGGKPKVLKLLQDAIGVRTANSKTFNGRGALAAGIAGEWADLKPCAAAATATPVTAAASVAAVAVDSPPPRRPRLHQLHRPVASPVATAPPPPSPPRRRRPHRSVICRRRRHHLSPSPPPPAPSDHRRLRRPRRRRRRLLRLPRPHRLTRRLATARHEPAASAADPSLAPRVGGGGHLAAKFAKADVNACFPALRGGATRPELLTDGGPTPGGAAPLFGSLVCHGRRAGRHRRYDHHHRRRHGRPCRRSAYHHLRGTQHNGLRGDRSAADVRGACEEGGLRRRRAGASRSVA